MELKKKRLLLITESRGLKLLTSELSVSLLPEFRSDEASVRDAGPGGEDACQRNNVSERGVLHLLIR